MTNIILGSTIEYTKDDDFTLTVESESEIGAEDKLRFVISKNETADPVINNIYFPHSNSAYELTLTKEDKGRLQLGDYIYKLVLESEEGKIITQQSGNFIVKWGA